MCSFLEAKQAWDRAFLSASRNSRRLPLGPAWPAASRAGLGAAAHPHVALSDK